MVAILLVEKLKSSWAMAAIGHEDFGLLFILLLF